MTETTIWLRALQDIPAASVARGKRFKAAPQAARDLLREGWAEVDGPEKKPAKGSGAEVAT